MGKKNKKQRSENGNKNVETTQRKGGSAIAKDHQKAVGGVNQQKIAKKTPQSPLLNNKKAAPTKKIDENQLKDAVTNIAGKKKKKHQKKKKSAAPTDSPLVTPVKKEIAAKTTEASDNEKEDDSAVTLTKRIKNRLKSKMKKEIILKGKSKLGLADPKLVARKLAKLKNKAEPHSKAAQRNILMLEKLLSRLLSAEKKQHKKSSLDTSTASAKTESDESLVDSDEDMEDDSDEDDEATEKVKPAKKEKKAAKSAQKQNGKAADGKAKRPPKDDKFFLFVGNLPKEITNDVIIEHFKSAGTLQKVKIPVPRRNKTKRFAYIQLADEPSRQKALELHGSIIGEKKITVLFADKSKGRSGLMSKNAKLNAVRKQATSPAEMAAAKPKKNKNKKKQKPKKSA